ncbi:MAG TPA: NAD-dependent epimerase/dehydratase family protein [Candidatus Methylacidiphilales bacterium]|nr:NAD-dependent epimerase/dehydratase family protein [Candidatus Methylacidiphilales bacterium]
MNARRAIVTGASGHLGFHVAGKLLDRGITVDLLVRNPKANENIVELLDRGARVHVVDFRDLAGAGSILAGADVLFHLAAENTTDPSRDEKVRSGTIDLTRATLSAALAAAIPVIVYTSSVVVLGRSFDRRRLLTEEDRATVFESAYVRGKADAERYCEQLIAERQADLRRIYPSWVIGPGDPRGTPPHQVINQCVAKGQRFWFNGGISLTSVQAVAAGHVEAWLRGRPRGQYVLGGANLTFREFFTTLAQLSGQRPPGIFLPKPAIVAGATVLKAVLRPLGKRSPLDPAQARAMIGAYSWYDSSRAIQELGYEIPEPQALLREAVRLERMRRAGTYSLGRRRRAGSAAPAAADEPPLLITGVPGWLGNRFVDVLINGLGSRPPSSRRVHLLVEPRFAALLDLPPRFRIFPGDLANGEALRAALAGVGTVIHLAGAIYPPRTATLYRVNFEGTRQLIDACIHGGIRRFLYMSTDSVCGHGTPGKRVFDETTPPAPYGDYGASKHLAEQYLLERTAAGAIDGTILRGFWFFGPYAPARQTGFLQMMRRPRQIVFGNGKNYRSISHVDNTITAFLQAENEPRTIGRWYWVGDRQEAYTVDDIYRILCEAQGNRFHPIYLPGQICAVMRGVDALLRRAGRLHPTVFGIAKFDFDIAGSIAAAQRDFNYQPVTSLAEYARELAG